MCINSTRPPDSQGFWLIFNANIALLVDFHLLYPPAICVVLWVEIQQITSPTPAFLKVS